VSLKGKKYVAFMDTEGDRVSMLQPALETGWILKIDWGDLKRLGRWEE